MTERELLRDCLRRLNRIGIPYYLTGSMASNYWGIPRTTHDLDFVLSLTPGAVAEVVREFGGDYYLDENAVRAAFEPPHQFNAIDTRSSLKIDFWLPRHTAFDEEMFRRRVQTSLFEEQAWIASAEDVILHKLVWNRITPSERQLADAAGVYAVQRDRLDINYLERWATELEVAVDLPRIIRGDYGLKET